MVRLALEKTSLDREWRMKEECKGWRKGDRGEATTIATEPGLQPAPEGWQ